MATGKESKSREFLLKIIESKEITIPISKTVPVNIEVESHPYVGRPSELSEKISRISSELGGIITLEDMESNLRDIGWDVVNLGHQIKSEVRSGRLDELTVIYNRSDTDSRDYRLKFYMLNPSADGEFADWDRKEFNGEITPEQIGFLMEILKFDRPTITKKDFYDIGVTIHQMEKNLSILHEEGILQKRGVEYAISPIAIKTLLSYFIEQEEPNIEKYDFENFERVLFSPEVQRKLRVTSPSGIVKRIDIERASGFVGRLSQPTISSYMRRLKEKGKVKQHGEKPFHVRWEFLTDKWITPAQHPTEELETIAETPEVDIVVQEDSVESGTSIPIELEPIRRRQKKLTSKQAYNAVLAKLAEDRIHEKTGEMYGTDELSRSQVEAAAELRGKVSHEKMLETLEMLQRDGYITMTGERKWRRYRFTGKVPLEEVVRDEVVTEPPIQMEKEVEITINVDELMLSGVQESREDFRRFMVESILDNTYLSQEHTSPLSGRGKSCLDYVVDGLEKRGIQHLVRFLIERSVTNICCFEDEKTLYPDPEVKRIIQIIRADQTLPLLRKKNGDLVFDKKYMVTMGLREAREAGDGEEYQKRLRVQTLKYLSTSD